MPQESVKSRVLAGFPKGAGQINRQQADRQCWELDRDEEICLKLPYSSNYGLAGREKEIR